jgi:ABC-type Fe3+ transport system permease subunit
VPHWLNNPFSAGIATLTINYCAYECENLRAGLAAVDRGQHEAALTLGLGRWETLRLILLPQMIPISLPTVINDFIYLFKDSSILSYVAVLELTQQTNALIRLFGVYTWQFFTIGALLYLALSLPLGRLARMIEGRLRQHTFAQGRDMTTLAGQTLGASVVFGWVFGALAVGFSLGALAGLLGQMVVALVFTLLLLVGVMILLGIPVYGVAALIRPLRRSGRGKPPAVPQPLSAPAGISGISGIKL